MKRSNLNPLISVVILLAQLLGAKTQPVLAKAQSLSGLCPVSWSPREGKVWIEIPKKEGSFLLVEGIDWGAAVQPFALDRAQLGATRVVRFELSGKQILMRCDNLDFRVDPQANPSAQRAIRQGFPSSILFTFALLEERSTGFLIDLTPFLVRDAMDFAGQLSGAGTTARYVAEKSLLREADGVKVFPKNLVFKTWLSFAIGRGKRFQSSGVPDGETLTLGVQTALVALPELGYTPRVHHPRSGYMPFVYHEPLVLPDQSDTQRFIVRHRLQKKDPAKAISEALVPIVYYVDQAIPEPIFSAVMEGASWWKEAFVAAGYKDAFEVKPLPHDIDPLDVRYHVINWVYRDQRGWSYGDSVSDPRTGEIIKAHVSLGALRIRHLYNIMLALSDKQDPKDAQKEAMAVALDRIRQLSCHEVGHTLGLGHNYGASADDRASVMDYPHALLSMRDGQIDLSKAYSHGLGAWDKLAIAYGYSDWGKEDPGRLFVMLENSPLHYFDDADASGSSPAHPLAHQWDNGPDAVSELAQIMKVREKALNQLDPRRFLQKGEPFSHLQDLITPIYLLHRYQIDAVAKLIGGRNYSHRVMGDSEALDSGPLAETEQRRALRALLDVLNPDSLRLPKVLQKLPPPAPAWPKSREALPSYMGRFMDPLAAAETIMITVLKHLLNPERLARLTVDVSSQAERLTANELVKILVDEGLKPVLSKDSQDCQYNRLLQYWTVVALKHLEKEKNTLPQVRFAAQYGLEHMAEALLDLKRVNRIEKDREELIFSAGLLRLIESNDPMPALPEAAPMPPGAPIGD